MDLVLLESFYTINFPADKDRFMLFQHDLARISTPKLADILTLSVAD